MNTQNQNLIKNWHVGFEQHDLESFMQCYDDNATVQVVDMNHPPKTPLILHGKEAIRKFYSEIISNHELNHHIQSESVNERTAAFVEQCRYANGTQVIASDMCELKDGKILKQTTVQAWDV